MPRNGYTFVHLTGDTPRRRGVAVYHPAVPGGLLPGAPPPPAGGGGPHERPRALKEGEPASQAQLLGRLYQDLEQLEREIALRAESLQAVTEYLSRQKDRLVATPALWPTEGHVTSPFGPRTSPFTGQPQQHTGVDIAAPPGTPIRAPADGIVTFAGTLPGYGHALVLTHGFGFKTCYRHNDPNP